MRSKSREYKRLEDSIIQEDTLDSEHGLLHRGDHSFVETQAFKKSLDAYSNRPTTSWRRPPQIGTDLAN